ncbi:LLM class flavin-dependent oxidoreductase [Arsenicicoccus dermatophilus]|uniref:LLM class flavin-dependent oxidoreductase n=1 Tax=Arsenicicoccus dermatophilus TaxID=1076331 RepID=UPI001F4C9A46|nr:LLM class flavin-dependent oxidoreductase [Arsenicicoccus dermatophilus]MCH8611693.1 LLM class flavin-dependent oxidoreductase [Arsenicicoccus dermatophilus]
MSIPLSILDLAHVAPGQSTREALQESIALARKADQLGGFERLWYAEHHNMRTIASAATSVLVGQVLAATQTIRVGAGGVMLPNHSPLVIAEQFGTLAELYPDRVDLGLGRAPGTDQQTWQALRRDPRASDRFPQDVQELQGYLGERTAVPGIHAYPGWGTRVPLYVLGSSMFGAQLAATLGLPYAFASHFAPDQLRPAMQAYRDRFRPSEQLTAPRAIAALNVIVTDDLESAQEAHGQVVRQRVRAMAGRRGADLTEAEVDLALSSPFGAQVQHMMQHTAVGTRTEVAAYLEQFQELSGADELMVTNVVPGLEQRERALEILATL